MTDTSDSKRSFFVSYKADLAWVEWVGAMLEQAGYTVLLDVWTSRATSGLRGGPSVRSPFLSNNYFIHSR
jgi:TIR domain-containing protein